MYASRPYHTYEINDVQVGNRFRLKSNIKKAFAKLNSKSLRIRIYVFSTKPTTH